MTRLAWRTRLGSFSFTLLPAQSTPQTVDVVTLPSLDFGVRRVGVVFLRLFSQIDGADVTAVVVSDAGLR
jgi:hypothetical protein